MLSELERPKPAIVTLASLSLLLSLPLPLPLSMSAPGADVEARREWEVGFAVERLEEMQPVDLPLCRLERVAA
jgi:hypothetical protein